MEWEVSGILQLKHCAGILIYFCQFIVGSIAVVCWGSKAHTSVTCGINPDLIKPDLKKGFFDLLLHFFNYGYFRFN